MNMEAAVPYKRLCLLRRLKNHSLRPEEAAYEYVYGGPLGVVDESGESPHRGHMPDCAEMAACLAATPNCGGKHKVPISLMLCVFWQEDSFGPGNKGEEPGNCTLDCFKTLKQHRCYSKYKNFNDFKKRATNCEKAQAAYAFMQSVKLDHDGPGPHKIGDYRGETGEKVRDCSKCIDSAEPVLCFVVLAALNWPILSSVTNDRCANCYKEVHK